MSKLKRMDARLLFTAGFSLFSAYTLAFLFEGQVLYSLVKSWTLTSPSYLLITISAQCAGLLSSGLFFKRLRNPRRIMLYGMGVCLLLTIPFFFAPSIIWLIGLVIAGYASGCVVASAGFFLKRLVPKEERIKTCADILIYSNVFMIAVNVIEVNASPFAGLSAALLCALMGMLCIGALPAEIRRGQSGKEKSKPYGDVGKPLLLLSLFILVITINSGLMYQVINPAFEHLTGLVSWYWAVPYIVAIIFMRNLPMKMKRSKALYVGMVMIVGAFIGFMVLGRNNFDYIVVDTLMLGACGIFDLFWWSILAEMLDYTSNPVGVFGIGLAANVLGVLIGDVVGIKITSIQFSGAEVAVVALTVASITLALLPVLNQQLVLLLKSHTYLAVYGSISKPRQSTIVAQIATLDPLTAREQEVLESLLEGKSNYEIGKALFISENTVKTHLRNIFSKYDVGSRAELISKLLKNQIAQL